MALNECIRVVENSTTNEVATGEVWTDGKPIYRKCFKETLNLDASSTTTRSIFKKTFSSNVDKPLNHFGTFTIKAATASSMVGYTFCINDIHCIGVGSVNSSMQVSRGFIMQVYSNVGDIYIYTIPSWGVSQIDIDIALEYTKSS